MPDIKTEMHKVISEWNKPETTVTQSQPDDNRITNNVSRRTFEYVRDNPGITRKTLVVRLEASGFRQSSTTSLITQFLRGGLFRDEDGKLYAVRPTYEPTYKRIKAKRIAKSKPEPKPELKPAEEAPVKSRFIIRKSDFDPKKMLEDLSAYQAHALYCELKPMFGA